MHVQITEGELCFWDDAIRRDIEELCHTGVYPPRIPVRVTCGEFVRGGVFTTISFSGICGRVESVSREFNLELTKPQPAREHWNLVQYFCFLTCMIIIITSILIITTIHLVRGCYLRIVLDTPMQYKMHVTCRCVSKRINSYILIFSCFSRTWWIWDFERRFTR